MLLKYLFTLILILFNYCGAILKEVDYMMAEKIELVLVKRKLSKAELARKLNCSSSNLYAKFARDNFSEKELFEIGNALDCKFEAYFTLNDTKERF